MIITQTDRVLIKTLSTMDKAIHSAWSSDGCIVLGIFDRPNELLDYGSSASVVTT
jgi:hypothetical protein